MRTRPLFLAALTIMAALAAAAQTVTVDPGSWSRYSSTNANATKLSTHQTADECTTAVPVPAVQQCRNARTITKTAAPAAPAKPPPDTRLVNCPDGTKPGLWPQTAGYYAVPAPDFWAKGTYLPAAPTAAQCPPIVVAPPVTPPTEPPPVIPPVTPPPVTELPSYNEALVPTNGAAATLDRRITETGEMPYRDPDGMGAFRTVCQWSKFGRFDPIVYPGLDASGHLHVFWGNSGTVGKSTPESIRTTGGSTCRGGIVNRSAYWAPAMINTSTGRVIAPNEDIDVYYKTGYGLFGQNGAVVPFPMNFRMIAGDSKSRIVQGQVGHFDCNGSITTGIPANCSSGVLMHIIEFPHCWNGKDLDSPDHRSHVAYPSGGACPALFPVHLPQVTYRVKYNPAGGTSAWRLSSDVNGTAAGSSSHGDWMHGWEQPVMDTWVARVIRQGLSGGSHIIGDGRVIY